MQPPGPSGRQWTIKLPSSGYYRYPAGSNVAATSDAEPKAQRHGSAGSRGGADKQTSSHQPQQRRRKHKNKPAPAFANVFMAGAYYSSAMHTTAGPAPMGAVYWQPHNEDASVVYGSSATEQLVIPQVWWFPPWWVPQQTPSFGSTRQGAVMCADRDDSSHEPSDEAAGYGQQNPPPLHHLQQQRNWNHDGDHYEDEVPSSNGQGDGDAPSYYGGGVRGGAPEDIDVLLEEQQKVVALLAEIDKRHEKQLAFERILQEQEATACWRRRTRQQPRMRTTSDSDSVDVLVKAAQGHSVPDRGINDSVQQERWYPSAAHRTRASTSLRVGVTNDDEPREDVAAPASPTVTVGPQVIVGMSASHVGAQLVSEPVAVVRGTADTVHGAGHPKEASVAVRSKEKKRPLKTSSPIQGKERVSPQPAQNQPPQKQDASLAMAGHQQRRLPEHKRPFCTWREYHNTRK